MRAYEITRGEETIDMVSYITPSDPTGNPDGAGLLLIDNLGNVALFTSRAEAQAFVRDPANVELQYAVRQGRMHLRSLSAAWPTEQWLDGPPMDRSE